MTAVHTSQPAGGRAVVPTPGGDAAADASDEPHPPGPGEYDSSSLDAFFGLLKNERRRRVVRYLDEESPTTTLSDLAEHIAAAENDKPMRALNAQERKRVYIQLYQYHLPAMDKVGVIEFDGDRGTVERTPKADHLTELLAADGDARSGSEPSSDSEPAGEPTVATAAGSDARSTDARTPLPDGGRPVPSQPTDTWATYYLGLGLVGVGLFVLQRSMPAAALVDGAVVGVLLMAAVSCALARAVPERGRGRPPADEEPSPGSPAAASAGDAGPAGTPGGGRTSRGARGAWRPPRVGRTIVEQPSSGGSVGGSAD